MEIHFAEQFGFFSLRLVELMLQTLSSGLWLKYLLQCDVTLLFATVINQAETLVTTKEHINFGYY